MNTEKFILNLFSQCDRGRLLIRNGEQTEHKFVGEQPGVSAVLDLSDKSFYRRLVWDNDIGLGESYINGEWDSPDPTNLIRWFLQNRKTLMSSKLKWAMPLVSKLRTLSHYIGHRRNANSLTGSRKNIEAHYDLGNDFYELLLDETMTYSSAYFADADTDLERAQEEKYDRICRKLGLKAGDHVLEVGCGWAGFACFAAKQYGCHVTGVTISPSQYDYAVERVEREGLTDLVSIEMRDYRKIEGTFDRIVSIEMIEAVGHEYLPEYFATIDKLLTEDGLACIQVITSADQRYKTYLKESDYIRKHIFPGSNLPAVSELFRAKADSDLNLYHMESFGLHYSKTLDLWRERFLKAWPSIAEMGFDERFKRKWDLYFCYCSAGFRERHINVAQVVFGRANSEAYTFEQTDREPLAYQSQTYSEAV